MRNASYIAALALAVVPAAPGVASGDPGTFPETVIIGKNKELHLFSYTTGGAIERHYGGGDSIVINYNDGMMTIDGIVYLPQAPAPPTRYSIAHIREHYGNIPMLRDIVGPDSTSEAQWNSALRQWAAAYSQLLREVTFQYQRDVERFSKHDALNRAVSQLKSSALIDSVRIDSTRIGDQVRLYLRIRGEDTECSFDPSFQPNIRKATDPVSESSALALLSLMRSAITGDSGSVHLTLQYGTVNLERRK